MNIRIGHFSFARIRFSTAGATALSNLLNTIVCRGGRAGKQMNADVGLPSTHSKGMGPACRHTRFAARLALFVALAHGPSASAQITFDNTTSANRISHAVAAFAEVVCSVDTDCDDGNACTADTCNAGSCLNSVESAGTVCRASAAPCDATETCDGVSITCPVDGLEPDDTPCDDGVACTDATCQAGTCVFADDTGQIIVNVEVDVINTGVTRTLDFLITNCGGSFNAKTASVVFDGTGFGTRVLSNINADADWIAVREGHTLRRLAPLSFLSCAATVDLTGINALVSGDFQDGAAISQDGLCDITDFSVLARVFNTGVVASSGIGADATGDGTQGATDFAAIQVNFFSVGEAVAACPASLDVGRVRVIGLGDVTQAVPLSAIPVDALPMIGAEAADLNGDGMVDASDIREFARRHNLPLSRSFERTLSRLESGKVGRRRR